MHDVAKNEEKLQGARRLFLSSCQIGLLSVAYSLYVLLATAVSAQLCFIYVFDILVHREGFDSAVL